MAGVVASNVRSQRAKSLSLKSTKEDVDTIRKLQEKQELQIELNKRWKEKVCRKNVSKCLDKKEFFPCSTVE